MGLDITAYSRCRIAASQLRDADDEPEESAGFMVWHNTDFPGRCEEFPDRSIVIAEGDNHDFRAGSYSGYNAWREQLAELAGYDRVLTRRHEYSPPEMRCDESAFNADSGPFWELICYSDCEGVLGTATAQKLAADFAQFQPKADAHTDERFRERYADWRRAFDLAADGGLVQFH